VYSAGEEIIAGADSRSLARSIRQRGQVEPIFVESILQVPELLTTLVIDGDVVVTQGAGTIAQLAQNLSAMVGKQGSLV
jgi:UDP-N-acetylmuramate--alanine ligase